MRQFLGALSGRGKLLFQARIGLVLDSSEQALVIQEKFRSKHALAIELLVEVRSRLKRRA